MAMAGPITVLIADDHALFREGTRRIVEDEPDMRVVGEASDGPEAVRLATTLRPAVVLMDIAMPGLNGIEATRAIKEQAPDCAVLVLTAYDDDPYVFALLDAGAAGYLLKSVDGAELVEAIRSVSAGDAVLHPAIARKVLRRFTGRRTEERDGGWAALSAREREVLRLAGTGMSNKEVALRLGLSVRTVQVHLAHIFEKLGVASRTEAVVLALRRGWLTLEDLEVEADD